MQKFASQNVKQSLTTLLSQSQEPDGLAVVPPDGTPPNANFVVRIPERLLTWLLDLRLLRQVPLAYLVPDPALLPPESIRFFHVDRMWTDRLIDGVMSTGNIGTLDMTFTRATLTDLRRMLDEELGLTKTTPISGMLIRSELVERWPDLIVEPLPAAKSRVIRQDVLSKSIMIVLFAGIPGEVRVREPDVGLRFGVELNERAQRYKINAHDRDGKDLAKTCRVELFAGRVLHVDQLKSDIAAEGPGVAGDPTRSRDVAINLRQPPYIARFCNTIGDDLGSQTATKTSKVMVRGREVLVSRMLGARGRSLQRNKGDK
jgi:hypothetical protein